MGSTPVAKYPSPVSAFGRSTLSHKGRGEDRVCGEFVPFERSSHGLLSSNPPNGAICPSGYSEVEIPIFLRNNLR